MIKTKRKSKLKVVLIIVAAAIIVIFTAGMIATSVLMGQQFSRGDYAEARFTADYYYEHYKADYPREEVEFQSGKNTLKGFIYGADNDKGLLVFAHGIGSGHEHYMKNIIWFVDEGWRVFTYDATGSGYSEGNGTRGLQQSALDLDAALTFAEGDSRLSGMPVCLMGHSWGGYAVSAVLNFDHEIAAVASISGYNEPLEMTLEEAEKMMGGFRYAMIPFIWTYNTALFGKNAGMTAVDGINKSNAPILIIHGTDDQKISYNGSSIISKRDKITNPNTEFLTLDGMGHSNMFLTDKARKYIDELNADYEKLYDSYDGEIPDAEREKIYAECNRDLVNEPNEELLSKIDEFLTKTIGNTKSQEANNMEIFGCNAIKLESDLTDKQVTELYLKEREKGKTEGFTPVILALDRRVHEMVDSNTSHYGSPEKLRDTVLSDSEGGRELMETQYSKMKAEFENYGDFETFAENDENLDSCLKLPIPRGTSLWSVKYCEETEVDGEGVYLVRIPTDKPWEAAAWIPFCGWNNCPTVNDMVKICRFWYEGYNAAPAFISGDIMTFWLDAPVSDKQTAREISHQYAAFCDEFLGMEGFDHVTADIMTSNVWTFWWD